MKSTGIVRNIDELGRIVIPIELRRALNVQVKDALEIYVENDKIILKKYAPDLEKTNVRKNLEQLLGEVDNGFAKETIQRAIKLI